MGLFSKSNEISKAKEIYNKAQKGTLKARVSKYRQINSEEICMIQLRKTSDSYMVVIRNQNNEILQTISLV